MGQRCGPFHLCGRSRAGRNRLPSHHASHECCGNCAAPRAIASASPSSLVPPLLRSRLARRPAKPRALRAAQPPRSIAATAPLRRVPRRRFPHRKVSRFRTSDPPGRASGSHPTQVSCGCVRGSCVPVFGGLSGTSGPLRPLEIVGPRVYRCGMRRPSSSGALATPPVPGRHADDTRRFRDRYTSDMRKSGGRHALHGDHPRVPRPSGAPGRRAFRPAAPRFSPLSRGAGRWRPLVFVGRGRGIGAKDRPGIVRKRGGRRPVRLVRHRDCLPTGAATVPLRQPVRVPA